MFRDWLSALAIGIVDLSTILFGRTFSAFAHKICQSHIDDNLKQLIMLFPKRKEYLTDGNFTAINLNVGNILQMT
ncbi:uncharacterized protein B0P05DRAFT_588838 [Gilbertella persicaria]|uniref:Uncharacterized protein n=1 Tax=Rhizopus stolonifer TaxID=4846 RepID=A0A367K2R0_RHIST|nr:uncharacterized protein B0P05DRAFT_588838 [Gilbertella persicaria]KAI8072154.1 hypothetical protein B0P05DRAFT_588838 [Gilbertella persicaria]RCH96439.1 hypothetical protein CU098_006172 [Rhizopus stolonifer]